ncbi:TPA: excisionase [Yersinia enterocolitica]|uniref:excisionase n=1 Tax=Yersinia TaxID=629 RepID=UPI000682E95F|nr:MULTISPECIES: excisionase [Yersinia]HDL7687537.1 excisionase [Yersinia enterocolitica]HDL7789090.1 excisionase [Yersinia enterocolitica]HDL8193853.1 excisionase [Yersinia enterocolitica]
MAKLLTLEEWCDETYKTDKPTIQTLQRWARNGNFYPAAEKHGRQYRVKPNAIYIDPKDFNLGKKIKDAKSAAPARNAFMEKVINDSAEKVRCELTAQSHLSPSL